MSVRPVSPSLATRPARWPWGVLAVFLGLAGVGMGLVADNGESLAEQWPFVVAFGTWPIRSLCGFGTTSSPRSRASSASRSASAQQQLVALTVKMRLAQALAPRDGEKAAEMLLRMQEETQAALEGLRDLARGIYPPLLADKGLPAALEAQARKSAVPVQVMPDGVGRYEPEVEAAVYFAVLEALQNVSKCAEASRAVVRLRHEGGWVAFSVEDDGRGFDPRATGRGSGLQGMMDRLSALGGAVEVRSRPGEGVVVTGRIPVSEMGPDRAREVDAGARNG